MDTEFELMKALRTGHTAEFFKKSKWDEYIKEQPLGEIYLPTGKIVANDPLVLFETQPFARAVAAGRYPVILYIHHIDTDKRVAFAELRFTKELPAHFELALIAGQAAGALGDDEFFGYGVDSGIGGFMDECACKALQKLAEGFEDGMWPDLEKALDDSYVDTYSTANVGLPDSDCNIAVFSSGFGDGVYPTFWGMDAKGDVCCLITDFLTVDTGGEDDEGEDTRE
ncbi:DUF4241 domain-containing protein [Sporomusa sphaeroides]|uniref:DUF4241 domain-containing protein n=1 Tax=Sporomusa sphaeroides DSM 2875 TaxID=1337886 RepID=A0ABP2C701_9FIRM|nr:DUF4241 domain-containing protein [Sporomusa sphaeroides]OLS54739.1 hypothetical protein SPSPH_40720 [Sporomusa sphaeroides DSM 2875]CVK20112.1 hypothetical protein SSPH_02779 [Sporomusa sphaeroides DSM 2875]